MKIKTLLYRGSKDGFESEDFHRQCDGHSNTITIIKVIAIAIIFPVTPFFIKKPPINLYKTTYRNQDKDSVLLVIIAIYVCKSLIKNITSANIPLL